MVFLTFKQSTSWRIGKTINGDSSGLWRHYEVEKFYSKYQYNFQGRKHSKRQRNKTKHIGKGSHAPMQDPVSPECAKQCWKASALFLHRCMSHMHSKNGSRLWKNNILLIHGCRFGEKVQFSSPNPQENQPINMFPLIHNCSFRTR